jgi:hypothetical protein
LTPGHNSPTTPTPSLPTGLRFAGPGVRVVYRRRLRAMRALFVGSPPHLGGRTATVRAARSPERFYAAGTPQHRRLSAAPGRKAGSCRAVHADPDTVTVPAFGTAGYRGSPWPRDRGKKTGRDYAANQEACHTESGVVTGFLFRPAEQSPRLLSGTGGETPSETVTLSGHWRRTFSVAGRRRRRFWGGTLSGSRRTAHTGQIHPSPRLARRSPAYLQPSRLRWMRPRPRRPDFPATRSARARHIPHVPSPRFVSLPGGRGRT